MEYHLNEERHAVHLTVARLYTDRPFHGRGGDLRRAVTSLFPDHPDLHHHLPNGGPDYSMPRVRYTVLEGIPHLVGVHEGGEVVNRVAQRISHLTVGEQTYPVAGCDFIEDSVYLGASSQLITYFSRTPWIALNQNNRATFDSQRNNDERLKLLERILIGNFLSLAKGIGVCITSRIYVKIATARWSCLKTPQLMLGFEIRFISNMMLPEFLGLGKMVAKGFGLMQSENTFLDRKRVL